MCFVVVGEDFGDEPPVVTFSSPKPNDSQTADRVTISGTVASGAENSDVRIQVALADPLILDLSPTPKATPKQIGKYNETGLLGDGYLLDNPRYFRPVLQRVREYSPLCIFG